MIVTPLLFVAGFQLRSDDGLLLLWEPKWRAWCAMLGASLVAAVLPPSVGLFVAIDLIAAAIVLSAPLREPSRLIGWLFIIMAGFGIGTIIQETQGVKDFLSASAQRDALTTAMSGIGWVQFAILFAWGAYDTARYYWPAIGAHSDGDADTLECEA